MSQYHILMKAIMDKLDNITCEEFVTTACDILTVEERDQWGLENKYESNEVRQCQIILFDYFRNFSDVPAALSFYYKKEYADKNDNNQLLDEYIKAHEKTVDDGNITIKTSDVLKYILANPTLGLKRVGRYLKHLKEIDKLYTDAGFGLYLNSASEQSDELLELLDSIIDKSEDPNGDLDDNHNNCQGNNHDNTQDNNHDNSQDNNHDNCQGNSLDEKIELLLDEDKKEKDPYLNPLAARFAEMQRVQAQNARNKKINFFNGIYKKTEALSQHLLDVVFGQDQAVLTFVGGYFKAELSATSLEKRRRPKAIFLFAGPAGVGKTFLAEEAAIGLNVDCRRFDMSEYCDKEANIMVAGVDASYKAAKKGVITGYVRIVSNKL